MSEDIKQRPGLSRERRALLELRLKAKRRHALSPQRIPRGESTDAYPLSYEQERLWFLHLLNPNSLMHHLNRLMTLEGPLDVRALQKSFDEVVRRHESLRTTVAYEGGQPAQRVAPARSGMLPLIDLLGLPPGERESRAAELATRQAREPFDAAVGPLMRAALLRLSDEKHMLLLTLHHIITDWWSFGVLYRELATLYRAFSAGSTSPLAELPIQYGDFARWQRERLQGAELEALLSYWRRQLAGAPQLLSLPTTRPRPAEQTYQGRRFRFQFPKELYEALDDLGRSENVTAFVTMLSVFNVLLYRYTAQEDILVGTPVANRSRLETEGLIGFLLNTLVLRGDLSGDPTFRQLLGRLRGTTLGAFAHQDLPFQRLVEEVRTERNLAVMPLVQVCFIFLSTQTPHLRAALPDSVGPDFNGLGVRWENVESIASEFDLTLALENRPDYFDGFFEYSTDLFDEGDMARMAGHLRTLMEAVAVNPDVRISELPLLTEEEKEEFLLMSDGGTAAAPAPRHVHRSFEEQAEKTPDAAAVVFEGSAVTYRELNERANRLARFLRQLGVGPEVPVGILFDRSIEMVVGLLAVLKAGGAYLPLDPSYPPARLSLMLEDAQAPFVLTHAGLGEELRARGINVVRMETAGEVGARQRSENLDGDLAADNLAYVIYTSGSTGRPKGVQVSHGQLSHFLNTMRESPGLRREDVVLAVTTITFDISTLEIFLPLTTGARLVLVDRAAAADGQRLASTIERHGVTVMQATPTTWRLMLEAGWAGDGRLKMLSGGEAMQPKVADQLLERGASLWNMYGPTETTVWSHVARLSAGHEASRIGRPIAGARSYVLNHRLQPVPVGVTGEIYIGGDILARGYLHDPALTAERFIPDPFSGRRGARLYRTGDLGRPRADGRVDFLGRVDTQVKVRGHRIELGEIEAALNAHPDVDEAVVLAREDADGWKWLTAYVVEARRPPDGVDATRLTTSSLHHYLKGKLPDFMIPAAFVMLESLPRTSARKIDRGALPAPTHERPTLDECFRAPRSQVERKLVHIWESVLQRERIGVTDNFFELGGHSLLLIRLSQKLQEAFGRKVPVIELFKHPTISLFAQYLVGEQNPAPGQSQDRAQIRKEAAARRDKQREKRRSQKARQDS